MSMTKEEMAEPEGNDLPPKLNRQARRARDKKLRQASNDPRKVRPANRKVQPGNPKVKG